MTYGRFTLRLMNWIDENDDEPRTKKLRSAETWAMVRREWEAGETGASLAKRYDVGLANLWRRRAAEGWTRKKNPDPVPEPAEGWAKHIDDKLTVFMVRCQEAREVAQQLILAMQGEALEAAGVPLWHLAFLLHWRAEHLTAETAARDRAWLASKGGWTQQLWDHEGWLRPLARMDEIIVRNRRQDWREDHGIPPSVVPWLP